MLHFFLSKPESDKVLQQKNKQTNKRPFFLPKIIKVFPGPILQNLKGRSVLDNLKIILLTSRKRCRQAKSSIFLGRWSKTQNGDQNRIYPSLTLQTAKCFPSKRVLKTKSSILEPNSKKSERKVRFGQFCFENDSPEEPTKCRQGKKFISSGEFLKVENAKW